MMVSLESGANEWFPWLYICVAHEMDHKYHPNKNIHCQNLHLIRRIKCIVIYKIFRMDSFSPAKINK